VRSVALFPKEKEEFSNFNSREIPQREKLAINYVYPRIRNRTLCRVQTWTVAFPWVLPLESQFSPNPDQPR